jgi:PPP family 3-phenylpropionic acid transporter
VSNTAQAATEEAVPSLRLSGWYFFYLAALGAFSPYFPLYLDERGLSAVAISGMMSLWYGTRMVSPSLWGHLTLHARHPIRWLRIGVGATLLCFAGFLFRELPLAALVAVMAAFSFFYNAVMPQFEAVTLSHLTAAPQRYGRIRLWGSVGFLITASALGPVFDRIGVQWLPWVMLPLFALLLAASFANDYGPDAHADSVPESLLQILRRPGVGALLLAAFFMQVAHGPYYVFFSLHLAEAGYSKSALGAFWAVGVLAEIVMFWFAARVLARWGAVRMMRLCMAAAIVRFIVTALVPGSLPALTVAQLGHALTFGLFHSAGMQRTARLFPGRLMGQGQGLLYGLSSGVGGVTGALLAGQFWGLGGGRAAFLFAAVAACCGLWLTLRGMQPGDPATRPKQVPIAGDEAS